MLNVSPARAVTSMSPAAAAPQQASAHEAKLHYHELMRLHPRLRPVPRGRVALGVVWDNRAEIGVLPMGWALLTPLDDDTDQVCADRVGQPLLSQVVEHERVIGGVPLPRSVISPAGDQHWGVAGSGFPVRLREVAAGGASAVGLVLGYGVCWAHIFKTGEDELYRIVPLFGRDRGCPYQARGSAVLGVLPIPRVVPTACGARQ